MKRKIEEYRNRSADRPRKTFVCEFCEAARDGLVKYLERRTAGYSKTRAVVLLVLFCAAAVVLFSCIAVKGFCSNSRINFRQERISRKVITAPEDSPIVHDGADIRKRLAKGRRFLDSLADDPRLRRKYDSLLSLRPGLLDSLKKAEIFYKQE